MSKQKHNKERFLEVFLSGDIYNLEALSVSLGVDLSLSVEDLMRLSYEKWAEGIFSKLDGEFVLVFRDLETKEMIAGRDFLGSEMLYYKVDEGELKVSTELSGLIEDKKINFGFIAEYLLGHICSFSDTPYQGVFRIPPGHYLKFKDGKYVVEQFYQLKTNSSVSSSREENLELIEAALKESITKRLSPLAEVSMQLSGGIDSSTIYSLSKNLDYQPAAISMVFEDDSACELDYISSWEERSELVGFKTVNLSWVQAEIAKHADLPSYPNGVFTEGIRRALGSGALMTGYGGDELFSCFSRRNPFFKLRNLAAGFCPESLKPSLRNWGLIKNWIPNSFNQKFEAETNIRQRLKESRKSARSLSNQKIAMDNCLFNGNAQFMRELELRDSKAQGVKLINPFLDKHLVELCFSLPDKHFKSKLPKGLLRELPGVNLPEKISLRTDKADFTSVARSVLLSCANAHYFENLALYDQGWLRREEVLEDYKILEQQKSDWQSKVWSLWSLMSVNEFVEQF